jgi:hypothetical protein
MKDESFMQMVCFFTLEKVEKVAEEQKKMSMVMTVEKSNFIIEG